jgi:hypothetical protein
MFVVLLLDVFNALLKLVVKPDDLSTSTIPKAQLQEVRRIEQWEHSLGVL